MPSEVRCLLTSLTQLAASLRKKRFPGLIIFPLPLGFLLSFHFPCSLAFKIYSSRCLLQASLIFWITKDSAGGTRWVALGGSLCETVFLACKCFRASTSSILEEQLSTNKWVVFPSNRLEMEFFRIVTTPSKCLYRSIPLEKFYKILLVLYRERFE